MHEGLLRARLGEVVSEVSQLDQEENKNLGAVYDQLLEIYSPIWLSGTDQVIAVAEFYQVTEGLDQELAVLKPAQLAGCGAGYFGDLPAPGGFCSWRQ